MIGSDCGGGGIDVIGSNGEAIGTMVGRCSTTGGMMGTTGGGVGTSGGGEGALGGGRARGGAAGSLMRLMTFSESWKWSRRSQSRGQIHNPKLVMFKLITFLGTFI